MIKGIFDRLDFTNNTIRILDYKTGSGNVSIPKDVSSVFTNSDNKIVFQLLLYVYILSKTSPEKNNTLFNNKTVIAGAYMLKKNVKSISFLNKGEPIEQSVLDEFENGLNQLLHTILSPSIPFTQTDDLRKCSYCDFKNICNR
mgnify:CR=1 FL=1